MATIFPPIENILRLKVRPTEGELHLLHFLETELDDSHEVYFNPFLDGDRPDIIIMKPESGVVVIEVKDWDLSSYQVDEKNSWSVILPKGLQKLKSPQAQAFGYKRNLYDLHLPVVGLKRLTNPNFYNLVHCFVYFHRATKLQINVMYEKAQALNANERDKIKDEYLKGSLKYQNYERTNDFWLSKKKQIQRDNGMSISSDNLQVLSKKIRNISSHVLFDDEVYRDFKRRLSPPEHVLKQGLDIKLDSKQSKLALSAAGKEKVKGVAGCGKTTILASRAIHAHKRHRDTVLILTFNITLKNYIRDKLSDLQGGRDFKGFEISNYHQFFNSQLNNTSQDMEELVARYGLARLYDIDLFAEHETLKYQTVFIDEIQDYKPEWVKIIRDNFLCTDGEIVLFGDDSQNIYSRESGRSSVIVQGFGRWNKLSRSYRTDFDSPLNSIFKEFQVKFLAEKYVDCDLIDTMSDQMSMGFSLLKYELLPSDNYIDAAFERITDFIKGYDLHPNDIIIISSKISPLRKLNELLKEGEKTHCMFETYQELAALVGVSKEELLCLGEKQEQMRIHPDKSEVERIRRIKKNHFYANSGHIKLSTTHSYKGLESKTVFYLMREDDSSELVYTSITRSTENLIVLDVGGRNPSSDFFSNLIE